VRHDAALHIGFVVQYPLEFRAVVRLVKEKSGILADERPAEQENAAVGKAEKIVGVCRMQSLATRPVDVVLESDDVFRHVELLVFTAVLRPGSIGGAAAR